MDFKCQTVHSKDVHLIIIILEKKEEMVDEHKSSLTKNPANSITFLNFREVVKTWASGDWKLGWCVQQLLWDTSDWHYGGQIIIDLQKIHQTATVCLKSWTVTPWAVLHPNSGSQRNKDLVFQRQINGLQYVPEVCLEWRLKLERDEAARGNREIMKSHFRGSVTQSMPQSDAQLMVQHHLLFNWLWDSASEGKQTSCYYSVSQGCYRGMVVRGIYSQ